VALISKGFSLGLRRMMCSLAQRMAAFPRLARKLDCAEATSHPGILAITADLRFYSCVLSAACSWGWSAEWASTMNRGLEVCGSGLIQIVVYDRNLPHVDWRYALDRLNATASQSRIILAAPRVDEDLWRMVLSRHGYDVLKRSANSEQLKRELRFAWLSLQESGLDEQRGAEVPVLS
jgi:DNA-binding response OmpR family regulator